jgi:hypothetical protein
MNSELKEPEYFVMGNNMPMLFLEIDVIFIMLTEKNLPYIPARDTGYVTGAQTAFAEKHGLRTQGHELTKRRRKT